MENPKSKFDQIDVSDIAEKPVKRPRLVAGTRYTAAEIHEIFRRFSIQRPEPKGELEHVNAFTHGPAESPWATGPPNG